MNVQRRLVALLGAILVVGFAWAAAHGGDEHPKGEHPKGQSEHPKGEHPSSEHHGAEHPGGSEPPMPAPGPEHARLASAVGTWRATVTFRAPGAPEPVVSEAVEEVTSICGGLFIMSTFRSVTGTPFEGHSIDGYDTAKKKYVGVWVDTQMTGFMQYEGTAGEKGVVTYTGTSTMPDGTPMQSVSTAQAIDDAHRLFKMWMGSTAEGPPMLEIAYERAGGTAAGGHAGHE